MSRTIKIKISGHGADTDAPTVDDWLNQIEDYLHILKRVEVAVAEDSQNAIEWRITNASKNSPLEITLESFPRVYAVNVDNRASIVARHTAEGFAQLQSAPERPPFFNEQILAKALQIFERVTNGLSLSEVDFGEDLPRLDLRPVTARAAAVNARMALSPANRPYREAGSIEGFFKRAETDGFNRNLVWIKNRITGDDVKCVLSGAALEKVGDHKIDDVFKGRRLRMIGVIQYKTRGKIAQIEAADVKILRQRNELPAVDDILDENFTGGVSSEDYLENLRNGDHS
ncbi:MAG: hypothetical protein ACKVOI_06155 [Dongiaceae bacterium]